jgi:hypothetical protein
LLNFVKAKGALRKTVVEARQGRTTSGFKTSDVYNYYLAVEELIPPEGKTMQLAGSQKLMLDRRSQVSAWA